MDNLTIYYDDLQEGMWFKNLNPLLSTSSLEPITGSIAQNPKIAKALKYDRADIILAHNDEPILVVERTIEVPSGHNVGQRFARIAGAAEESIPSVYFFPYKATKHGGETAGPRYANLRLFYSLSELINYTGSAVTTINWPVDEDCEIITTPEKDNDLKIYLDLFLNYYIEHGMENINEYILNSEFQQDQYNEVADFSRSLKRRTTYDSPPPSVKIYSTNDFSVEYGHNISNSNNNNIVVYEIGMNYLRSDPYTGTAMLYEYLYKKPSDNLLVLHFKNLATEDWNNLATSDRKDIKLYRHVSDGILFTDGYIKKSNL
ncbi:hypothetical protein [Peribacillus acanthi]|uniref:hypothetical protein n=1 Tax=Peribacillus acanthi TaxID=2171554 RepID=UPI000D3ED2A4|nr:hypothetical protein [Peribacillus acanthi]